jgi:hypothetical protein
LHITLALRTFDIGQKNHGHKLSLSTLYQHTIYLTNIRMYKF